MEKRRVFGTGGELLVHQLLAQGVRYAFTMYSASGFWTMAATACPS